MSSKTPPDPAAEKQAKLAQALRANLRRRKAAPRPPVKGEVKGGDRSDDKTD